MNFYPGKYMIKKLYFCESCRTEVKDASTLQFVEENSDRGFCSEKCILDFYRPYMAAFEEEEDQLREQYNFQHEDQYLSITSNQDFLNKALSTPDEVWCFENELEQKFFTHVTEVQENDLKLFYIIICSYVDDSPSFVFYRIATQYEEIANFYRREAEVEINSLESLSYHDGQADLDIDPEVIEALELKKSSMLAQMLASRKASDIDFEEFASYDEYMDSTLESPDDVYEYEDDEGDTINTFIKTFFTNKISFFYIVVTQQYTIKNDLSILPIIGFPTIDKDIYQEFAKGKKLNETLKN
jgi:hypothetical protein